MFLKDDSLILELAALVKISLLLKLEKFDRIIETFLVLLMSIK